MLDPQLKSTEWPSESEPLILEFFNGKPDGFFVEIGANNGFDGSNTRALWQLGWRGVMVEADPRAFGELARNYQDCQRVRLVHAAICEHDGTAIFYAHNGPATFSSMDTRWVNSVGKDRFKTIRVPAMKISSLGLPNVFDFLSIDTEGMDSAIIESMPPAMRPRLILAEVNKADGETRIKRALEKRGYRRAFADSLNVAYALED